ncbi:alpha/beta hydrolase [uncultured Gimesia sp.]|jgi:acetyl esterase/lipase|uniref:alpha/beta hydrolase n=1 Tax=uncultured Gimesia sp. TaxID=1678688 RepID=UPI002626A569|nr:alpha/beta hydrolase [uncultured Gimesia sp.]
MPTIASRVLTTIFLLAIATYLIPEKQDSSADEPDIRDAKPRRSAIVALPKDLKIIEDISYRKGRIQAWKLDLVMQREPGEAKRPALIFVHGGSWSGGDKSHSTINNGPVKYARKGYVCISVNYRLSDEAPFPACLEDVKCAVRWLRAHADQYHVDPDRIGGYGNFAGAHLVSLLGLVDKESNLEGDGPWQEQSSLLNAVCVSAIPTDFTHWPGGIENKPILRQLLDAPDTSLQEQAIKASPITYVHAKAPPFLLFQGTKDRTVDVSQADRFAEALNAAGAKDVTYHRYPEAGHSVFNQYHKETYALMEEFFDRTLFNPKQEAVQE